jgi:hypothetical protein
VCGTEMAGCSLMEPRGLGLYSTRWKRQPSREQHHAPRGFGLFMVAALENDELIHEAPAIVGCQAPSALACKSAS